MKEVIILGLGFLSLFTAMNIIQFLTTQVYEQLVRKRHHHILYRVIKSLVFGFQPCFTLYFLSAALPLGLWSQDGVLKEHCPWPHQARPFLLLLLFVQLHVVTQIPLLFFAAQFGFNHIRFLLPQLQVFRHLYYVFFLNFSFCGQQKVDI